MAYRDKTPKGIKLNERQTVEEPMLKQLKGLGWEVLDLKMKASPSESFRESFIEVVMFSVLREQIQAINPWMETDQIEEVVKQLTQSFPSTSLLENNQYVLRLLLENTSVSENRKTGEKSPTVHFIDFGTPSNNRFIAVCQFKVRIPGSDEHIIPDMVLLVNGIPLVVVECKSPKRTEPIPEAIDQMLRYSDQRGEKGEGNPELFYFNQFVVATCRNQAKFGTISSRTEKHFFRWSDPYPRTLNDLEHGASSPNDQQRLTAGMLDHRNLLDLLRSFTLFSVNDKGQAIKIVGRYQQFRAVKMAVKRLKEGKSPRERSGIVWHTQGSGKSLTMMFMVREMFRHTELSKWKVVFVTDRTQLEKQLQETSQNIGFSVKMADGSESLKSLLRTDSSDLVMAMIHKFRDSEFSEIYPELNASPHILVITDEAHRSQYKNLGANLDRGIPNASRIGYTGTPIDKTEKLFGDYIDKYTMRQSIEDGVTLEIVYEGRTNNAEIEDQAGMDAMFEDVFSDYNWEQRLDVLGFGTKLAYLEAESVIEAKANDMVQHYLDHVFPNGFKGQVVASSREAAACYKTCIDKALKTQIEALEKENPMGLDVERLKRLETDVVISTSHNDKKGLKQYGDKSRHEATIKSFKMDFDSEQGEVSGNIGIVIVANMLLTGFDAPIEQVMYLDKVVQGHNLLQAIARVNRVGDENKEKGFVVDYVGVGHHLKKAIDNYDEREQKNVTEGIRFPEEELRNLEASHERMKDFFERHGLHDLDDLDACYDLFYDEVIRFEFIEAFKDFTKKYNLLFPAKEVFGFKEDFQRYAAVSAYAGQHLNDSRMSMIGIPAKLRTITNEHLRSRGIEVKVEPISILSPQFEEQMGRHERTRTQAATIEHAIRHHLEVELDDDPELQASFAEALAAILEEFRGNWEKIRKEMEKLRERIRNAASEPTYGLHKRKQMPFFRLLRKATLGIGEADRDHVEDAQPSYGTTSEDQVAQLVDLTQQVVLVLERELKLVDFWKSPSAKTKLRSYIQRILLSEKFMSLPNILDNYAGLTSRIMELAEQKNDTILHAR